MKNFKIISMFVLALLMVCVTFNTASASGELKIHNQTRYTISKIYVAPYGRNYSSRKQNSDYIPSGKGHKLKNIPISRSNRYWNIKVVFSNGKSYECKKADLYSRNELTLYSNGSRISAEWD